MSGRPPRGRPQGGPPAAGFPLRGLLRRYGLAVLLAGGAFAGELSAHRFFEPISFQVLYPTAFLTAWLAGLGPAFLHLVLALGALYWTFVELSGAPPGLDPASWARLGLYAAFSTLAAWLIWRGRRAQEALRLAEEALRRSEGDLKRAQAVAEIGSWRLDVAKDELSWSEHTYRMFGLPPDAPLTYADFLALVHPEDRALVDEAWKSALLGRRYDIEHRIVAAGRVKWVHERAELERDGQGRVVRGVGTVQDVTERRKADEAVRLLAERRRFQLALEAAADAMVIVDEAGRIVFVNGEAERLFGWKKEELEGRPVEVLIPERFRRAHVGERGGFMREPGGKRRMAPGRELSAVRKDGTEIPVEIGLTRFDEAGRTLVAASVSDISARVEAQRALRESEQRFRLLVEGMRDYAIFMVDPEGKVTVWNEGAQRILGYTAEEALGGSLLRFSPPEERSLVPQELRAARERGSLQHEGWRMRKDGSRLWAGIVTTPIYGPDGRHIGYGKVIRDLTEPRRAERELQESRASLERSVLDLEAFAYTVSHDLRSPLRAIEGYAHFLERRLAGADEESRRMLSRIGEAAERLDRLIRDVLSYGAVARVEPKLEPVELEPILAHISRHYPELARAQLVVRAPLGRVLGQTSLITQILSNILTNAVKFVPRERAPRIELWTQAAEDGFTRVVIQDNGIGIPRDAWERVFKPFERLHPAGTYPGTGIGLAIVKRAVERLGGRVTLTSEPGQGSRFSVELKTA